jgi:ElaB/YqjD/DUF883 family membrane-anchored ribosome-binding protein
MTTANAGNSAARETIDRTQETLDNASQTIKETYEAAQKYAKNSEVGSQLRDFVEREPWIAIATAFAIGYVAAQIVKRIS